MNKVSIIICAFNAEKTISRCLQSVIKQSYSNLEILIINDGSTDRTLDIINKIQDSRIRVINQENKGLSYSRNIGIKKSKAPYIIFVDADDCISKNLVEICIKSILNNDLVIYSYKEVHHIITINRKISKEYPNKRNLTEYGYVWNKMYKKSLILKNNIHFSEKIQLVEDLNFNKQYLKYVNKIGFVEEYLYYYYRNSSKVLSKKKYNDFLNLIEINIKDKMEIVGNDIDYYRHLYLFLIRQYLIACIRNKEKIDICKIYSKYRKKIDGIHNLSLWEKYYLALLNKNYGSLLYISTKIYTVIYDFL